MFKLGVDIGGTGIKAGLISNDKIVDKQSVPTNSNRPYIEVIADIANLVRDILKRNGLSTADIKGVGVGMPGSIKSDGTVIYSNNIAWSNVPLGAELSAMLGVPVKVENDANVAGLGENLFGSEKYNTSVLITLGTGVGAGIVIDGKIFSGFKSAGAELGHTLLVHNGEPCTCGRRGCFEAYSSATSLIRDTKRAMQENPSSLMWQGINSLDEVNGLTSFNAAKQGDAAAQAVVDFYIDMLAEGLVNIINSFRPEVIMLGGGVSGQGEVLLAPLRKLCQQRAYGDFNYAPFKIINAKLGNDAGIVGAAALFDN